MLIVFVCVIVLILTVVTTSVIHSGNKQETLTIENTDIDCSKTDAPGCPGNVNIDCSKTPNAPGCPGHANIDCSKNPDAPGCQNVPTPPDIRDSSLRTCTPMDGQWSIPDADEFGRSKLNSPCCQPPNYELPESYKTCSDKVDINEPLGRCIANCCTYAESQAPNFDPSWYPMARCGCSMWCNNKDVPHFKKYGTAVHYITGDLAEARTSDSGNFIGGTGFDFSGM